MIHVLNLALVAASFTTRRPIALAIVARQQVLVRWAHPDVVACAWALTNLQAVLSTTLSLRR